MYKKDCLALSKLVLKMIRGKAIETIDIDDSAYSCKLTYAIYVDEHISRVRKIVESNVKVFKKFYADLYERELGQVPEVMISDNLDTEQILPCKMSNGWRDLASVNVFDRALLLLCDEPVEYDSQLFMMIEVAGTTVDDSCSGYLTIELFQPDE